MSTFALPQGSTPIFAPLLLADRSPCLRLLVLTEILGRPAGDEEVRELLALREQDETLTDLLARQTANGSWAGSGLTAGRDPFMDTIQALLRLSFLGFGTDYEPVKMAAESLFSLQRKDGAWPMPAEMGDSERYSHYEMIPLQTALPLRALAAAGYAEDPRAEKAYDWLLAQRLEDGAWPTGLASGVFGGVAGYRRLPHSRWGCRSNTTGALLCLAYHPERRNSPEAARALDKLLARETRESYTLGFEVARLLGAERARGFLTYYALPDAALLLELCSRVGASAEDQRVRDLAAFARDNQGPFGLWTYDPKPQVSRWLTFTLLRALSKLDNQSSWVSLEPPTPFQEYGPRRDRF